MGYSTTFAAGTLLHEETVRVMQELQADTSLDEVDPDVLDINSRSGRERRLQEVVRRLRRIDRKIWNDFLDRTVTEQRVILYYACMNTYDLVADIHLNAVLPAWRSITQELHRSDIERFLDHQADNHPEVENWSPSTHDKVQQVMRKMLREVGLLQGDKLQRLSISQRFWTRFVRVGDAWFLEALFLSHEERSAIIDQVRSGS
jgi:hypothetical protein